MSIGERPNLLLQIATIDDVFLSTLEKLVLQRIHECIARIEHTAVKEICIPIVFDRCSIVSLASLDTRFRVGNCFHVCS